MIDALEHDRALEVVAAERQRDLRNERRYHRPVRLHMGNVVEQQPPHSNVLEIVEPGRCRARAAQGLAQFVVVGMIGQRDVGEKSAGLILERAQRQQMIDAILERLDMAVQHRAVGWDAELMRFAVHGEPLVAGQLAVGDRSAGGR